MIQEIFSDGTKRYIYESITSASELEVPFSSPFAVLIWGSAASVPEFREAVCERLISRGCRHVITSGVQDEEWDAAADVAFVKVFPNKHDWEKNFVMTSSHGQEPIADVIFKFVVGTNFDHHFFTNFLLLQIGHDQGARAELIEALIREAKTSVRTAG